MKWNVSKIIATGSLSLISLNVMAAGNITGYRGQVFYFTDDPVISQNAYQYYKDGVLFVQDGKVLEAGDYATLKKNTPRIPPSLIILENS